MDKAAVDRWITGNYGEDQFKMSNVEPLTAKALYEKAVELGLEEAPLVTEFPGEDCFVMDAYESDGELRLEWVSAEE